MAHSSRIQLLAIAAATALTLAACGGGGDDSSSSGGAGGSSTGGPGGPSFGGSTSIAACANVSAMSTTQPVTADEKNCILDVHNAARAEVKVGKLAWDDTLAANAYDYAQKCIWGHSQDTGNIYPYPSPPTVVNGKPYASYGENLAGGKRTVGAAIDAWVSEKANYNGQPINSSTLASYGHYTQVVWGNTTKVGCGYAYCSSYKYGIIFVCQYSPPGNYLGETPY